MSLYDTYGPASVRRRRSQCSKIFSETARPIKAKFYVEPPYVAKFYVEPPYVEPPWFTASGSHYQDGHHAQLW